MNQREKEDYLREYSILKGQGKPFFPYAIAKDGAMACIVHGRDHPDGHPLRRRARPQGGPDHHHLHAAARVVLLLPLRAAARGQAAGAGLHGHDRASPRSASSCCCCCRSTTAARSATRCGARSPPPPGSPRSRRWPTSRCSGAIAGAPTEIELATKPQFEEGKEITASSGCLGCHKIGENGNTLGPNLTEIGARLGRDAIARTLVNPTAPMPSYAPLPEEQPGAVQQARAVRGLPQGRPVGRGTGVSEAASGTLPETQVRAMFDRIAKVYDRMNGVMTAGMHHRWRDAGGGPGRGRARRRGRSTWPPAPATWRSALRAPGRGRGGHRLLRGDARAGAREGARTSTFEAGNALDAALRGRAVRRGRRWASGRATSPISDTGLAEMRAGHRPGRPGGGARDHHSAAAAAVVVLPRSGSTRVVPALGRVAGDSDAYTYLPNSVRRFPRPAGAGGAAGRHRTRPTCAGCSPPAGSSPSTWGTAAVSPPAPEGCPARVACSRPADRSCPRGSSRTETRLAEIADEPRRRAGRHAAGTLAAGGKRLRPLLVFLCGGDGDADAARRAAVAVELLHMATLVHDDVLDRAPLRRGRPTVFATAGRAGGHRHRRPSLLAGVRRAGAPPAASEAVRALSDASSALARGELMQRADAWNAEVAAGALPGALPAEDGQPVRRRLPAGRAARRQRRRDADGAWPTSASGSAWPSRCSTTCSTCRGRPSAPASPAAPTCSTAP